MNIVKTNVNTADKVKVYKLTKSSGMMVQDAPAGLSVPVADWMVYNDPKTGKDGTVKDNQVLSIVDPAGVKYSTISATFIREFLDIVDIMEDSPFAILFIHGTTKSGKAFVSCELDCDYKA